MHLRDGGKAAAGVRLHGLIHHLIKTPVERLPVGRWQEHPAGQFSGQHFINQHPHRVDVHPPVDVLAVQQLRGHVVAGADDLVGDGQLAFGPGFVDRAREAEVHQLDVPVRVHQEVGGFDVAMQDPLGMGSGEGIANLAGDFQHLPRREGGAAGIIGFLLEEEVCQICSFEILHHEEKMPVRGGAELIDFDDVGVLQLGKGPRFAAEPVGKTGQPAQFRRQDFDGHRSAQGGVDAEVDCSHAAPPQHSGNLIFLPEMVQFLQGRGFPPSAGGGRGCRVEGVHQEPLGGSRVHGWPGGAGERGPGLRGIRHGARWIGPPKNSVGPAYPEIAGAAASCRSFIHDGPGDRTIQAEAVGIREPLSQVRRPFHRVRESGGRHPFNPDLILQGAGQE